MFGDALTARLLFPGPEAAAVESGDLNCTEALGVRTLAMNSFPGLCGGLLFAATIFWAGAMGEDGGPGSELWDESLYRGQSFVAVVTGDRNGALSFTYSRRWEICVFRIG